MRCRFCGSRLQPVHGHGACLNSACAMFGLNQDECCNGETCAVPEGGQGEAREAPTGERTAEPRRG